MTITRKSIRYAYWLALAFIKKNAQPIILSFLLSIIGIIIIISFSPYLIKAMTTQEEVIGIAGTYTIDTLPDTVLSKISNGLLYINEKGQVIPLLADTWEEVEKGKEYRFQIKKDLLWNDGEPFLAKDVNYKFKDVEKNLEGGLTLTFRLNKSLPIFPNFLTRPIIKKPLVGVAGLYKVQKARIESGEVKELQLTPNKPDLPIIVYKFYDTETKLVNAYKLGEITQMQTNKEKTASYFKNWKNTTVEQAVDYTKVMTLFFNMEHPLLKDEKDLRHSVGMAISKDKFKELGNSAIGPLPPTSWAYQQPPKIYSHNPDLSTKLLKKFTESTQSATLTVSTYYDYLNVADEIQEDLDKVGLKTKVEVVESAQPGNFDIFIAQMQIPEDPDQYFFWHSTQKSGNLTNYNNPRIDKILEDGRDTFKLEDRKKIYADFQRILSEDMPAYFLYYPYIYTIKRK